MSSILSACFAQDALQGRESARVNAAGQVRPFAPGIRIDWANRLVEVESYVVLREGMLELFACTPNTKEHESILCIKARPLEVFQALGLLGVEPGNPPQWDPQTETLLPARGPRLALRVRYELGESTQVHHAHEWMWDVKSDRACPPLSWVYSGSVFTPNGRMMADLEGTVVALVDFESALVSLPESRSPENEQLWLAPNTARIPPLGSPCVLLIQPLPASLRILRLGRFGRIWYDAAVVSRHALMDTLSRDLRAEPELELELRVSPFALEEDIRAVRDIAAAAGVPGERVTVAAESEIMRELDIAGMILLLRQQRRWPQPVVPDLSAGYESARTRVRNFRNAVAGYAGRLQAALRRFGELFEAQAAGSAGSQSLPRQRLD